MNIFSYLNFLEGIRNHSRNSKIFYASSCHIFGNPTQKYQNESTKVNPNSVYSITKYDAMQITKYYREKYELFCSVGILFNHESHLRAEKFVSKKIVKTAVDIKNGKNHELKIGNLKAIIDWGYAGDFIEAFNKILNHDVPDDFVVSSGKSHSIRDFIKYAFEYLDLDWENYTFEDQSLIKRKSSNNLVGDYNKLYLATGWQPKTDLMRLAELMVDAQLKS